MVDYITKTTGKKSAIKRTLESILVLVEFGSIRKGSELMKSRAE